MKLIIIASYQCLLGMALFLLVGMALASNNGSRVLFGKIDASVALLRIDTLNSHYFEFKNSGMGALYYDGYGKSSPIYSEQFLDEFGNWQDTAIEIYCGTGLDVAVIKPGESVFFKSPHLGKGGRIGIVVSTDPEIMINTKTLWSENRVSL